jgi:hypothetical protein
MTRTKTLITIAIIAATAMIAIGIYAEHARRSRLDRLSTNQKYQSGRMMHLLRLRDALHVSDAELRSREITEIDLQLKEMESGKVSPVEEIGEGARIIRRRD